MIFDYFRGRRDSFRHAFDGLGNLWKNEPNTRIHAFFTGLAVMCSLLFRINATEWLVVILLIGGVWSAEAMNTAVERVVDLSSRMQIHPLAKQSKDIAAAAVVVSAFTAVVCGLIIFLPKVWSVFVTIFGWE